MGQTGVPPVCAECSQHPYTTPRTRGDAVAESQSAERATTMAGAVAAEEAGGVGGGGGAGGPLRRHAHALRRRGGRREGAPSPTSQFLYSQRNKLPFLFLENTLSCFLLRQKIFLISCPLSILLLPHISRRRCFIFTLSAHARRCLSGRPRPLPRGHHPARNHCAR